MTRVIVAHRPETIGTADRAIMLAGGKVVQEIAVSSSRYSQGMAVVSSVLELEVNDV